MTEPKQRAKPFVPTRTPKKKTTGIFDNLRKMPQLHPVEEMLGLAPLVEPTPSTPSTPPRGSTPSTSESIRPAVEESFDQKGDIQKFPVDLAADDASRKAAAPPPDVKPLLTSVSPTRDFTKVANSIVREAVPSGSFGGKSKQLYDYLYSQTRGAIVPRRSVRISKDKLMKGADIGSEVTLRTNIAKLVKAGLIAETVIGGKHGGNEFEVFLPEEVEGENIDPLYPLYPLYPLSFRETLPPLETTPSRGGVSADKSTLSQESKTLFKTDDDDTHTQALEGFARQVAAAAKEVCGGDLINSNQERERWNELASVLADELKKAAQRTGTISSAPAFLAAHLRRSLAKSDDKSGVAKTVGATSVAPTQKLTVSIAGEEKAATAALPTPAINEGATRGKESDLKKSGSSATSNFSFEERRRYAKNQQPPLGNGWMVESASGKYDELIKEWLRGQRHGNDSPDKRQTPDVSACPDCHGAGLYYPEGVANAVKKCRHERLTEAPNVEGRES